MPAKMLSGASSLVDGPSDSNPKRNRERLPRQKPPPTLVGFHPPYVRHTKPQYVQSIMEKRRGFAESYLVVLRIQFVDADRKHLRSNRIGEIYRWRRGFLSAGKLTDCGKQQSDQLLFEPPMRGHVG
jgi:hypothetical protein